MKLNRKVGIPQGQSTFRAVWPKIIVNTNAAKKRKKAQAALVNINSKKRVLLIR